jgi:hypothetical protein
MLNDDVFSIVRVAGNRVDVRHFSIGNGVDFIERLTVRVAMQGFNVDPFVKTGINNATCRVGWITDKTILTSFPWR